MRGDYYEISSEIYVVMRDIDWSDSECNSLALFSTAMNFHVTYKKTCLE